jgi:hypothetical protein
MSISAIETRLHAIHVNSAMQHLIVISRFIQDIAEFSDVNLNSILQAAFNARADLIHENNAYRDAAAALMAGDEPTDDDDFVATAADIPYENPTGRVPQPPETQELPPYLDKRIDDLEEMLDKRKHDLSSEYGRGYYNGIMLGWAAVTAKNPTFVEPYDVRKPSSEGDRFLGMSLDEIEKQMAAEAGKDIHGNSKPTHYVLGNGFSHFVKEADFFKSQGGLEMEWGKNWRPVVAESFEHARKIAESMKWERALPVWYARGRLDRGRPLVLSEKGWILRHMGEPGWMQIHAVDREAARRVYVDIIRKKSADRHFQGTPANEMDNDRAARATWE